MRPTLIAAVLAFAALPAFAQTDTPKPAPTHHKAATHLNPYARASDGPKIDKGPYTPDANRAYDGGGVVIEGVPGGPPPTPTPQNTMPR